MWGGKRSGSGRPQGTGRYGVKTKVVRVPEDKVAAVLQFVTGNGFALPLYSGQVQAGFPSPTDDHVDGLLDLNTHLIQHPETTFYARVTGDSMIDAGISEHDLLVVDRSVEPKHGKIVIAVVNGEMTVKRLHLTPEGLFLKAENPKYPLISIKQEDNVHIWGVVIHVIKSL
jgi:DNA polymerase V